jgi:hypothetical protein
MSNMNNGTVININWRTLLPPIFTDFCLPEDEELPRYAMKAPFVVSGFLYATDGRACVRMLRPSGLELEQASLPPVEMLGWGSDVQATYRMPALEEPLERTVCTHCNGTQNQCRLYYECEACTDRCGYCSDGLKDQDYRVYRPRGKNFGISEKYLRPIDFLGATTLRLAAKSHKGRSEFGVPAALTPFFFEYSGVSGIVMPFKVPIDELETSSGAPVLVLEGA